MISTEKDRHHRHHRHEAPSPAVPAPPRTPQSQHDWDPEIAALIRWFIDDGQHRIPDEPFQLCPWIEVTNPNRFKEALLFDISMGTDGSRYRCGGLTDDLRRLKEKLNEPIGGERQR
jgi:hypothetical protein